MTLTTDATDEARSRPDTVRCRATTVIAVAQVQILAFGRDVREPSREEADPRRLSIIANPPGDAQFRALIDAFVLSGGPRPEDLQAALRAHYPAAVVRPRALAGERFDVWYVYRDGHWVGSDDAAT